MDLQYLSNFELRQMCYFMAVVEAENNFSRAAERLDIEQPPLSQRIRALEKALKVELFDRKRRPLQLTEAGKVFLEETQLALTHIERAIARAQRASRGEIGHLAVGIGSSIANSILPDILRTFRDRFPEVELELRELTTERQIQELRDRRLDVGFENLPNPYEQDTSLHFLPIVREPLVIALPETHPLAAQTQIPLKALENEPFILPSLETVPFYKEILNVCEQAGFKPNAVQKVKATWMITVLSLVAAELGVAILPSNVQNLQRKGVVYRAIQDITLTKQIAVVWRQEDSSVVLREFLKVIQEVTHFC
jgi:DNA-binding transcriptional LysR family regulator